MGDSPRPRVYISGPLTSSGIPELNKQIAIELAKELIAAGFAPLCPHLTLDIDPDASIPHDVWMEIDKPWVRVSHAILRFHGESDGADQECQVARSMGVPIYKTVQALVNDRERLVSMIVAPPEGCDEMPGEVTNPRRSETVLEEAARLTSGDRQRDYDHPARNFARIADLWNAYLRIRKPGDLLPEDVGWMAILMKVARDVHTPKRDNPVDTCGYARCIERIRAFAGDPDYTD